MNFSNSIIPIPPPDDVYCVGLTGGIGSGKTTVANLLAKLGAYIIDADKISHQITASYGIAIPLIRNAFGNQVIAEDGSMNRAAMRELVFHDITQKQRLENILHPLIRKQVWLEAAAVTEQSTHRPPYLVFVVPLLSEHPSWREFLDTIVVVDCEPEIQIARVMARSKLSREAVTTIMRQQATRMDRLKIADEIIHNNGNTPTELTLPVQRLHEKCLLQARKKT